MNVAEQKKALRKELISRRREISPDEKSERDKRIFERLLPLLEECSGVFTYVSTEIEVGTSLVIDWCFQRGKQVFTPVSGDYMLTFYRVRSWGELKSGRFGIKEPADRSLPALADKSSLCIVPALCCDSDGFRLGYGRGYYDRFLADFPGKTAVICYSDFIMEVPRESHDRSTDLVITDT